MTNKRNYSKIIEQLGKVRVRENEPMAKQTTFKIGGPADLFYEARTERELIKAIRLIREMRVPYFILGGGSNILVADKGFRGIVIKIKNEKLKIKNYNSKFKIIVGAGTPLAKVVQFALERSLSGLEFAVGIPGTVGGAVRGNAGAWRQNIGDKVSCLKVLTVQGQIKWLEGSDCQFAYRDSCFKKSKEIILEVEFELEKRNKREVAKKIKEYFEKRRNQPKEPSAGCAFLNPKPDSAGRLIDLCGLRGKQIGQAQISSLHANFIVNLGGASCQDVLKLITLAKKEVKNKFGFELQEEIEIVGEF